MNDHFAYDRRLFTSTTHALIGAAYLKLGDPAAAAVHLGEACRLEPGSLERRVKRDLAVHLCAGLTDPAEVLE